MAARPKPPNAGKGRKRGVPNKTTAAAREMFTKFLEANSDRVQGLFDRLAKRDPRGALEVLTKFAEFAVPKLSRAEIKADPPMREPPIRFCIFPDGGPGHGAASAPVYIGDNSDIEVSDVPAGFTHNDNETQFKDSLADQDASE